jgi:antitoxin FitA
MADITVRNLDDTVRQRLKQRAAAHGRSMEAEVRAILTSAVAPGDLARAWVETTRHLRGADVPLQERSAPRHVDIG